MIAIYQYLRLSTQSLIHTKAADARCSWGRKLGRDRHLAPGRPRQSRVLHELDHRGPAPNASRLPRRMPTGSGPGIGAFSLSVDPADDLAGSADDPFRHRARVEPGSCFGDGRVMRPDERFLSMAIVGCVAAGPVGSGWGAAARRLASRSLNGSRQRSGFPPRGASRIQGVHPRPEEDVMESVPLLDCAGRRRSPATLSSFHQGRSPRNKGLRYPPDPPSVEEIVAVMRACGNRSEGARLRAVIVVLWRAGLRISEALALTESDLDRRRGAVLVRHGKGGKRREVGMDRWAWEQLDLWLELRAGLPVGALFCVLRGPDPRPTLRGGRDPRRAAPRRRGGRNPATVRAPPAPPRPRGRDVARGHPAPGDPTPTRARRPGGHQHLSTRDRQRRDHPRRLRTVGPDDPRQPSPGARWLIAYYREQTWRARRAAGSPPALFAHRESGGDGPSRPTGRPRSRQLRRRP